MTRRRHSIVRLLRWSVPVFVLPFASALARAQVPPIVPDLDETRRLHLIEAARDPSLDAWQRDFMLRLAGPGRRDAPTREPVRRDPAAAPELVLPGPADGTWTALPPPVPANGHTAIYDAPRDRMVIYGGNLDRDVWELRLADPPRWLQIRPAGEAPPSRRDHTAIYDSARDRMVIFGGSSLYGGEGRSDTWALSLSDNPVWTRIDALADSTLLARTRHTAIYDVAQDRMIVCGGVASDYQYYNVKPDVWTLHFGTAPTWELVVPTSGPSGLFPGREGHSAIYDAAAHEMIVFGGNSSADPYFYYPVKSNDVWSLPLAGTPQWTRLWPSLAPPPSATADTIAPAPRTYHRAVYDPLESRMIVFGGLRDSSYYYNYPIGDTWAFSLGGTPTWTLLDSSRAAPGPRSRSAAVYDGLRHRLMISAGDYSIGNDVWAFDLEGADGWARVHANDASPGPRYGHSAIYDPTRERMVIFGGSDNYYSSLLNDTWALSLDDSPAWTQLAPAGTAPQPRVGHTAVYDPVRDRMLIMGGYSGSYRNDTWALSFTGPLEWTRLAPLGWPTASAVPSARVDASAIYDPDSDRVVVFGGYAGEFRNDTWTLGLSGTPTWKPLSSADPYAELPSPRYGHTAILDPPRHRMVLFGGRDALYVLDDVWSLPLAGAPVWARLDPGSTARGPIRLAAAAADTFTTQSLARYSHTAVFDSQRARMVVFGGVSFYGYGYPSDSWAFDLAGPPLWTSLLPGGSDPYNANDHVAVYDPIRDRMVVNGGGIGYGPITSYQLVWSPLPTASVPLAPTGFSFKLAPNPTRDGARLAFDLPVPGRVRITLYDLSGRRVREIAHQTLAAGPHEFRWDGREATGAGVAPGMYFLSVQAGDRFATRKLVVTR